MADAEESGSLDQNKKLSIMTWNINGIRAVTRGTSLKKFLDDLDVDIICFQETKITRDMLEESICIVDGYNGYFSFSRVKTGYSGVATFCRGSTTPCAAEEGLTSAWSDEPTIGCYGNTSCFTADQLNSLDKEGRAVLTEHELENNEKLVIINTYCPRADSQNEERMEFKLLYYKLLQIRVEALLESGRHVIVLGDLNVTHRPIDHCEPGNLKKYNAHPSRIWMSQFVKEITINKTSSGDPAESEMDHSTKQEIQDTEQNKQACQQEKQAPQCEEQTGEQEKQVSLNNEQVFKQKDQVSQYEEEANKQEKQVPQCKEQAGKQEKEVSHNSGNVAEQEKQVSMNGVLVDSFRYIHLDKEGAYTNWCTSTGARQTNYGKRLDYILGDILLIKRNFMDCVIRPEVEGSDHCPVVASLNCRIVPSKRPPSLCTKFMPEFAGKQQKLASYFIKKTIDIPSKQTKEEEKQSKVIKGQAKRQNNSGTNPQAKRLKTLHPQRPKNSLMQFFGKQPSHSSTSCEGNNGQRNDSLPNSQDSTNSVTSSTGSSDSPSTSQELFESTTAFSESSENGLETSSSSPKKVDEHRKAEVSLWKNILKGPPPAPPCPGHNEPCVLRTVKKKGPNYGRQFFCCARPEGHRSNKEARCKFFKWTK